MITRKHIFIVFSLMSLTLVNAIGQIRVFAQVDSSKDIYIGESFGYYIVIEGADREGQVDLDPLQKYNPQSTGNRQQSSVNIVNNRMTKTVTTIMTYSLSANRQGRIQLPPVAVTVDGKEYKTNSVTVNILKPGTTDKLELDVTLSTRQCYVGQPVIMTAKFYRYVNVGGYNFSIPFFDSGAFYFEDLDVFDRQVKEYRLSGGMHIFASEGLVTHNGKEAVLVSFSKVLIPKQPGRVELGTVSVSADVAVGRSRSRDRFFDGFFGSQTQYKRFMVSTEPLELNVLPLPEQGKPKGFYGLVGRYTISATAKPTTDVYMGDPIILTIKVGGSKYLKPVQWPALEEVGELAANFKIPSQKASATIEDGFKVFTQTIRPDNNRANAIPSIPLVYFDADTGSYSIAKTEPIKFDLKPSKRLTAADIEGKDFAPINKEVKAIKKGLSANYEGPDVLENMSFSPASALINPGYATIWVVPLGILILSSAAKFLTHSNPEKIAAKRRRQACSKAVAQLKKIISMDSSQRNELVVSIMKRYIGDRFDKMAGSLTGDDCHDTITGAIGDAEIADKFRWTIEHCEAARFASIDVNIDSGKTRDIIELIRNIEKKSKKCSRRD